jgi:[acyl-carrier-protein] S-malonyltransferase
MSASVACVFPGQGSQSVGMGRSLFDTYSFVRERFDRADSILGRSIRQLCFEGPIEELTRTVNTQPALFLCAVASCDVLRERGIEPTFVAGHSLGEYAALYASGVVDFEAGLRLVALRGRLMDEAATARPGAMAAVMGLGIEALEDVCKQASEATGAVVVVANDNSTGQTVLSGEKAGVDRACVLAKEAGAKRALPLPVSGAFHSPLMAKAAEAMKMELAGAAFSVPKCGFIPNFTARPEKDPEAIRQYLVDQITGRVRWVQTVRALASEGVKTVLEAGPGSVLAGLIRRIDDSITVHAAGDAESIEAAISACGN